MDKRKEYAQNLLNEYMTKHNVSLRPLAQKYSVSLSTANRWTRGLSDIPAHVILDILHIGIPVRCPHCNGSGFLNDTPTKVSVTESQLEENT